MPVYQQLPFNQVYAKILDQFVKGNLKKLIITMPPQHGKSELSTRRLPAIMQGIRPQKFCISSYNATKAREFSSDVQRIIADPIYNKLFPDTIISGSQYTKELQLIVDAKKTYDHFELYNRAGRVTSDVRAVGRGGALTGNPVDTAVLDDLYKDYKEGNSPVIRKAVIDWYVSVLQTRLHNDSQELIVFTRWHQEDLIGFLEKEYDIELLTSYEQLINPNPDNWYKINFPALMDKIKTEFDNREIGEALWPGKHNTKKLLEQKKIDVEKFESLYQGDPRPLVGLLYQTGFKTYPPNHSVSYRTRKNYTDTADTGSDYLCSICYAVGIDDYIYVLDVLYTQAPQESTEPDTARMLKRNHIKQADIESNNGGRAFARNIDRLTDYTLTIEWFHQGENKEARVVSNASNVQRVILFPEGWEYRWPEFYKHIMHFKKYFRANEHDDCVDALTGVYEFSGVDVDTSLLWG